MQKVHINFMKDLRNIEFEELFGIISSVVAIENIGLPTLTIAIDQLQQHTQELSKMNYQKIRHPLTPIIREQVNTRSQYLICLRMTIDAKMMGHKHEQRLAAQCLQSWLKSCKEDIYSPTISKQSRMVDNLIADRKESADIKEATALLDLDDLLSEIVELTANIRRNQLARVNDKDIYEVDGQALRKAAYKDLKILINVLESNYYIGANEEQRNQLAALNDVLNESLKDFRTLLKSKRTKRKNKIESATAKKELIESKVENNQQELEILNLPLVLSDEVKIEENTVFPKKDKTPASYFYLQT